MKCSLIILCTVVYMGFYSSNVSAQITFVDVSEQAGLGNDAYASAGSHGLGINWVDINNDGWDDLFVVGGQPDNPPKLFLNNMDGGFISDYAEDFPNQEDVAESFLLWMAVRYRADQISTQDYNLITDAIPNRLAYFVDKLVIRSSFQSRACSNHGGIGYCGARINRHASRYAVGC